MATVTLSRVDERVQVRGWVSSAATEFILCGVAFLVLRALIIALVDAGPFYRDEVTFTEGGLRMAANRLDSGDYIHGPVIYYLMLGVDLFTAIIKLVVGKISNATGFLYWYIENPETLRVLGRVVMSVGGAATIAATMYATYKVSLSRTQARIAGLILLGMPMFHHLSWYIKEDLWAALFGILAAASAYRGKSPVKAGVLLGFAIASKYTAVALAPALLLLIVTSEWKVRADWRFRVKGCLRFVLATTIISFILNPYALIHLGSFLSQLQEINAEYIA